MLVEDGSHIILQNLFKNTEFGGSAIDTTVRIGYKTVNDVPINNRKATLRRFRIYILWAYKAAT